MEGAPRFNKISPESEEYVSKREESKSYWTHWDVFGRPAMSALRSCRASLAGPARQPLERIAKIIEESKEDFITRLQSEKTAFYAWEFLEEEIATQGFDEKTFPILLTLGYAADTPPSKRSTKGITRTIRSLPDDVWV